MTERIAGGSSVVVAVLGAGRGSRLGGGKLDRDLGGQALGAWALESATALGGRVTVVATGRHCAFLTGLAPGTEVLINRHANSGLASSLRLAAGAAQAQGARLLLVMLADMPLIGIASLSTLIRQTDETGVTACRYPDGRLGPPACFGIARIPALLELIGDRGAGSLLNCPGFAMGLEVPDDDLFDVDTPEDLQRAADLLVARSQRRHAWP